MKLRGRLILIAAVTFAMYCGSSQPTKVACDAYLKKFLLSNWAEMTPTTVINYLHYDNKPTIDESVTDVGERFETVHYQRGSVDSCDCCEALVFEHGPTGVTLVSFAHTVRFLTASSAADAAVRMWTLAGGPSLKFDPRALGSEARPFFSDQVEPAGTHSAREIMLTRDPPEIGGHFVVRLLVRPISN